MDDPRASVMDFSSPLTDSDEALVARAKRDREAFACLYDRYVDQVHQFIYRRVKDHPIAEDITARAFFRALEQLPRFEWGARPGSPVIALASSAVPPKPWQNAGIHVKRLRSIGAVTTRALPYGWYDRPQQPRCPHDLAHGHVQS